MREATGTGTGTGAGAGEAVASIERNRARLERYESAAEQSLGDGRLEDAAACAIAAAQAAWALHPGRFASPRLEAVLFAAGRRLATGDDGSPRAPGAAAGRVLHVMTEAYASGGHTNIVRHWTRTDAARRHAVVATDHGGELEPVFGPPAPNCELLPSLRRETPLTERALELRALAADAELIVLHVHPYDAMALMAFPPGLPRPPIVFSNHADHCFWLGRGLADVLVDHRPAGTAIAVERRGIEPERCLPLPLPAPAAPDTRAAAGRAQTRASLGVPPEAVLVLTVGSAYKYVAEGERHLAALVAPVVQRSPRAIVLAVGPSDDGPWLEARTRTGNRVQALGPVGGLGALDAAADVYLESYPCSGGTCLTEAASAGLPVLTYAPDPQEAEILGTTPSERFQRATDPAAYRRKLERLVTSPGHRRQWSQAARAWAEEACAEEPWLERLEAVDAAAAEARPATAADPEAWPAEPITARDIHVTGLYARAPGFSEAEDVAAAQFELAARSPAARACFDRLSGRARRPELARPYGLAVAAPPADGEALAALVAELRLLVRAGVAGAIALTVAPGEVEAAVAHLEPLLETGGDLPVDLVPSDDPAALLADGRLVVRQPGDAWGDAPEAAGCPVHECAPAAGVPAGARAK